MEATLEQYDFIIIGGGTSGLVVASRLSENPDFQVLILEAGDKHLENSQINIPALWPSLLRTELDWNFSTVPQVRYQYPKVYIRIKTSLSLHRKNSMTVKSGFLTAEYLVAAVL